MLLAVELLLFEYRPRSIIPVALAAVAATGVRSWIVGSAPAFAMPALTQPSLPALFVYIGLGAIIGVFAAYTTRIVYWIEDLYEELPIHWMWWPVLGAIVVGLDRSRGSADAGRRVREHREHPRRPARRTRAADADRAQVHFVVGLPRQRNVGRNARAAVHDRRRTRRAVRRNRGATRAGLGVDPHVAALVGMASIFAGASHALLASIVFAFETTRQPMGLLPLLAGCSAAYLLALLLSRSSIMTEKLARRGTQVRTEYTADFLDRVLVRDAAAREVVTISGDASLTEVRAWLSTRSRETTHQGFPVVDSDARAARRADASRSARRSSWRHDGGARDSVASSGGRLRRQHAARSGGSHGARGRWATARSVTRAERVRWSESSRAAICSAHIGRAWTQR